VQELGRRSWYSKLWYYPRPNGASRNRRSRPAVRVRTLRPTFFLGRRAVTLRRGPDVIAITAYGLWEEYARQYGRSMFGLTSVQVDPAWRGRGLSELVMLLAGQAAREAGAEALHLHVYRANAPAWNLYHQALGFQPKWRWVTLGKEMGP